MTFEPDRPFGPDERLIEVARILAMGVSRLQISARRAASAPISAPFSEIPPISPAVPLDWSDATGLCVQTG